MAIYTYADEAARKKAAGIPLNNGVAAKPTTPVTTPLSATQAAPKTTGVIPSTPATTPAPVVNTPMSASAAATPKVSTPVYGQNVAGFDANNANHTALADAGQAWSAAKAAGDTAGMSAAQAKGVELRANSGLSSTFDSKTGVTVYGAAQPAEVQAQGVVPPSAYGIPSSNINQEAQYQINSQRADLQTAADKQTGALKNNAEYAQKLLKDSRALSDFTSGQQLNPFANMGKKSFDEGLKQRQRGIDDTYMASNLTNELNAVQQDLYNFDKLAPDKKQTLINEMTRIERDYGLQVGALTGQIPGMGTSGQTLASKEFEWSKDPSNPTNVGQNISNQISQLNLDSLPQEIKLNIQKLEQDVKNGSINQQTAEYQLKELTDPNSATNQMNALDLKLKELEASGLPEEQRLKLQQLRKSIANIGKVAPTSDYDKQMQDIKLLTAQAEYDELISGGGSKVPYNQSPDFAESMSSVVNGQKNLAYVKANAQAIISEYGYDGYLALEKAATPKEE